MNNTIRRFSRPIAALLIAVSLIPTPALADCTAPAAVAGTLEYFSVQNIFKYCNGTNWIGWGDGGTALPAGANTEIQFNASGVMGADSNFVWDNTNKRLGIAATPTTTLEVGSALSGGGQIRINAPAGNNAYFNANAPSGREAGLFISHDGGGTDKEWWLFSKNNNGSDDFQIAETTTGPSWPLRFIIKKGGNVGIGTSAPGSPLEVYQPALNSNAAARFTGGYSGTSADLLRLRNTDTTNGNDALIKFVTDEAAGATDVTVGHIGVVFTSHTAAAMSGDMTFGTRNSGTFAERMRITGAGKVGVGTTDPKGSVHISSTGGDLVLTDTDEAVTATEPALRLRADSDLGAGLGGFAFQTTADYATYTDRMVIDANGYVGIGTATPESKLHVMESAGPTIMELGNPNVIGNNNSDSIIYLYGEQGGVVYTGSISQSSSNMFIDLSSGTGSIMFSDPLNAITGTPIRLQDSSDTKQAQLIHDGSDFVLTNNNGDIVFPSNNVGIGTATPQSPLHVPDGKYAQFEDNNAGAPAAGDCDNNAERGRMSIDTTNNRLYICNGATRGWDYVALTN
ncbi:MAG: hypothetical protein NW701_17935 [Nitrospira sp.]